MSVGLLMISQREIPLETSIIKIVFKSSKRGYREVVFFFVPC